MRDGLICLNVKAVSTSSPLRFVLDSGAGMSAPNLDAACKLKLKLGAPVWVDRGAVLKPAGSMVCSGVWRRAAHRRFTRLRFAEYWVSGVQAGLHEREFFPGEAGLLGTGILSNFAITVDAPGARLILRKN